MKLRTNSRHEWINAFIAVMEQYREPRQTQGSVGALDYERAGNSTGGARCSKIVRPSVLDFLCDVELAAHRALSNDQEATTLFNVFYRNYKVEQITVAEINRTCPTPCGVSMCYSTDDVWTCIVGVGSSLMETNLCSSCQREIGESGSGLKKIKPAYVTKLPKGWAEADQRIRERVGRMFIARRIFPVGSYMASKDVRN